ncbi:ATP-dependent RNA helicase DHX29 isoform X5 [Mirounga angustirostris]|uniref:ATP-dependent RNA helicase DHX29 isoform X5 n=1 Tax=Mirounga angustirostris TaxID=9716 RepID=UPI001E68ABE6|nr:ATP-dependent RNA helicase DHX29 isoform X4 [Mirounga angustirostris]
MGGKNKKHKAPGAAAVRAAVSASRAKSAEAAALGEAQNKKSVARPPPAAAASTREPRVKQGPKIYSFNSANDSGGPANLDKSILKVVINHKLEQRIIGVINEHKKQNNDKGVISGRLTAKKLQDLYMALQAFSFKTKDIEDAMTNTLLQGGDLHSALDWLCLNLSDDALPEGFSQEFEEQQPKSRPKFQSPQTPATVSPPLQPKTKTPEDTKIKPKKEEKNLEVNMKEWILRYAEQQNEEEKSENSKSLEEEEKFDPNERYLHLAAKLLDAKEQAATFKLEKNKQGQKEAQEKIRKFQREMETLEDHPVFNPAIKISHQQNERKKPPLPTEEERALNFNLFEKSVASTEEEKEKKKEPHDVRNFDYTARSWTGKSPKQFLIDWVRKNLPKSPNPSFEKVPVGRYWKCRVKVIKSEDDVLVACPTILTEDGMQAQHLGATLALYHLVKGQSVHQLLPPTYRDVWLEWSDAEKKKEALNKMETNKPRDVFVAKLLNRLKQQQQQQQQQQRSGNKRGNSEDPEESWENLVSDEDFSALSLDAEKAEDLEPARTLFRRLQSTPKYQRLLKERQQLPVFKHRNSIVETLKRHRVVVVAGETGSGKSTQVPHFLLEDLLLNEWGTSKCNIVCTQPRRISAVSLATRVCDELGCENGPGGRNSLCGYQIRMESRASESTRLLYCTTGVLLRKLQEDGLLTNVSHVIVDEVHERSVQSDFLLIILKEILRKRSDLHLILMSATVDSEKFSTYFTHCPILRISGRSYPVEVFHLEDIIEETGFVLEKDSEYCQKFLEEEEEITINVTSKAGGIKYQEYIPVHTGSSADLNPFYQKYSNRTQHAILYMNPHKINLDLILELLIYLDRSPQFRNIEGAVLIFLPGLAHIQQLYDLLSTDRRFFSERYKVIALHSILSTQDQAAAFTVPPPGVRKIVLATNIAETGITIPDVVFVIDTGRTKENKYHESSQMSSLVETSVSKASALQRQGRAGRVRDGFCFRMYTRERFEGFMDYSVPEILRVPLEELCLHIMKCNLGSPEDFLSKALDPPQLQVISNAMNLLRKIGACELNEPTLTPLGQHLAALPVNVKIGKMLIFGAIFGCLDPVATLAAVMTEKSPFTTPIGRKDEADLAKSALAMADSDHLTIYNAYLGWKKARQEGGYRSEIAYCRRNFLNRTSLLTLEVRYTRVYLRETTLISPFPVLLFGGDIEVQHRERLLSIDGWISFQAPVKIAVIFKQLRVLIDSVLRKKLENPKRSLENDKILQIITELIKTENHN